MFCIMTFSLRVSVQVSKITLENQDISRCVRAVFMSTSLLSLLLCHILGIIMNRTFYENMFFQELKNRITGEKKHNLSGLNL